MQAQQIMKELQRVTTKNPKKVEAGKRLAYGIVPVIALRVISGLCYYIYQTKKVEQQNNPKPHPQMQPQTNKFEMD